MSRTRSFVGSTIFAYLYQGGVMIVGLWLTPFYLRMLGATGYGFWLVGLQILSIILLMDFGVVAVLPRDVAQKSGEILLGADWDGLQRLISRTITIVRLQTLAVGVAGVGAYLFWPGIAPEIKGPLGVTLLAFCVSFPLRMYAAILEGLQDLHFLSGLRIVLWLLVTIITILLLLLGWRLYALAIGWAVNVIGFQLAALVRLRLKHPSLVVGQQWVVYDSVRWHDFSRGSWVSVGQLSQILLEGTYVFAIAKIMGPTAVVIYSFTAKLTTVLANQPQLFVLNALPGLSQLKTSASKDHIKVVTTVLGQGMLILSGAIFVIAFSINGPFVDLWVGPRFFGGQILTGMILANMLMRHLDLALAQALFAMGHERTLALKSLADGIVTTLALIGAIHWFGLYGAPLGQILGVILVSLPTVISLFSGEFKVTRLQAISPYVPYFWRLVVACAVGKWLANYLGPRTYVGIVVVGVLTSSVYLALIVPYAWGTPLGKYIRHAIRDIRESIVKPGMTRTIPLE